MNEGCAQSGAKTTTTSCRIQGGRPAQYHGSRDALDERGKTLSYRRRCVPPNGDAAGKSLPCVAAACLGHLLEFSARTRRSRLDCAQGSQDGSCQAGKQTDRYTMEENDQVRPHCVGVAAPRSEPRRSRSAATLGRPRPGDLPARATRMTVLIWSTPTAASRRRGIMRPHGRTAVVVWLNALRPAVWRRTYRHAGRVEFLDAALRAHCCAWHLPQTSTTSARSDRKCCPIA